MWLWPLYLLFSACHTITILLALGKIKKTLIILILCQWVVTSTAPSTYPDLVLLWTLTILRDTNLHLSQWLHSSTCLEVKNRTWERCYRICVGSLGKKAISVQSGNIHKQVLNYHSVVKPHGKAFSAILKRTPTQPCAKDRKTRQMLRHTGDDAFSKWGLPICVLLSYRDVTIKCLDV